MIAIVRPFLVDKIVSTLEDTENFPGIADAEGFGQRSRNKLHLAAQTVPAEKGDQNRRAR